jgi:hypothetical protein
VVGPPPAELAHQHGDDQVAHEHQTRAGEQEGSAAEAVHGPERGGYAHELGDVYDTGEEETHFVGLA